MRSGRSSVGSWQAKGVILWRSWKSSVGSGVRKVLAYWVNFNFEKKVAFNRNCLYICANFLKSNKFKVKKYEFQGAIFCNNYFIFCH